MCHAFWDLQTKNFTLKSKIVTICLILYWILRIRSNGIQRVMPNCNSNLFVVYLCFSVPSIHLFQDDTIPLSLIYGTDLLPCCKYLLMVFLCRTYLSQKMLSSIFYTTIYNAVKVAQKSTFPQVCNFSEVKYFSIIQTKNAYRKEVTKGLLTNFSSSLYNITFVNTITQWEAHKFTSGEENRLRSKQ